MTENGSRPDIRADLGELGRSGRLDQFYKEWRQAQARAEMAQQTLAGALNDSLVKEARFKGAAELIYGKDATFEYNEQSGLHFITPNREARRALAKKK